MEGRRLDSHVFLEPTRNRSSVLDSLGQTEKNKLPLNSLHFNAELRRFMKLTKIYT